MKKSRFREEQMVTILREADRRPVPEVAKQHGVSAQTGIDAPICQDTRSGGLDDLLASAEIGHDSLVDLASEKTF